MFGARIAALRSRFGWSQAELARRVNISPSTVGMYEQGRREPSLEVIITLSRVLGVSVDFLLTGNSLCPRDWRALAAIDPQTEIQRPASDPLRVFSKDELLVLLAASVFGAECE
jgi:transcriptional regulator with XRE-family HTH domain